MEFSLAPEAIFHIGSFPVTNTLLMSWLVMGLLIGFAVIVRKNLSSVPSGLQNIVEATVEWLWGFLSSIFEDKELARKTLPLIATIFLFVLLANWVELLPGLGTIGLQETHHGEQVLVPFVRAASADLNFTFAIAVASFLAIQMAGIAALGALRYGNKFISFKSPLAFFTGLLELFSEITKIISFAFRLFGNIFAGEVLLLVILFLVPYLAPIPFLGLEIFVGLIQALIFAMLTVIFIKAATVEMEH